MKKAGIITHYDGPNHGAQLQLFGLVQCLKKLGYEAKALRFQKNFDFMGAKEAEKKYRISLRSIPTYMRYLINNGVDRTLYNIKKRKIIADFQKNNNLMGDYYSEAVGLDVVVIGSDEIFSIEAGPNPWYYGIGVPCDKQISYAASFGPTTLKMIQDRHVEGLIEGGLKGLRHIAVRDQNSADIVEHYLGYYPAIVCDPVLLYGFQEYQSKQIIDAFKREHLEKYCIVYSYDYNMNDDDTINEIKEFANKRGLKIYSVSYFHRWCDKVINPDPLDIFKWFACSEMVFTDTFHGSVLSLTTGAQFVSMIRGNGNKLAFLLEQYGVSDRKVNDFSTIEKIVQSPIDYSIVGKTIEDVRKQSMQYLSSALG